MTGTSFDVRRLDHFTANWQKQRFEYIPECMLALLNIREACQALRIELFSNAQDKTMIKNTVAACQCAELWAFMAPAYRYVFGPSEEARRWGLTCNCEEHTRMRTEGVKHSVFL